MKFLNSTNVHFDYWAIVQPFNGIIEGERDSQPKDQCFLVMTNSNIEMKHDNDTFIGYCPLTDDFITVQVRTITMLIQPLK